MAKETGSNIPANELYEWEFNLYYDSKELCDVHNQLEKNRVILTDYLVKNAISPDEIKISIWDLKDKKREISANQPTKECFRFTNSLIIKTDDLNVLKQIANNVNHLIKDKIIVDDNQFSAGFKKYKDQY